MIFGEQHTYQDCNDAQQILVFESQDEKQKYDDWYAEQVAFEGGIETAKVTNRYHLKYILRSVLESSGKYVAIVESVFGERTNERAVIHLIKQVI